MAEQVLPMRPRLISLLVLAAAQELAAQTVDERLAAVNTVFAGSVRMQLDRQDRLVIDYYEGNNRFRQDVVPVTHLDSVITFSQEEDAVVIPCLAVHGQCIDKEIIKLNTIRPTGRANLPRPMNDPEGTRAIAALKALVTAAHTELAQLPNETRERVPRRK